MIRVIATKLKSAPTTAKKKTLETLVLTARNETTRFIAAFNVIVSVRNEEGVLLGNGRYSPTPQEQIACLQQGVHPPGGEFAFSVELSPEALLELAKPGQPRYEIRTEFFSHRALRFCTVPLTTACSQPQNLTSLEVDSPVISSASLLVGKKRSVEIGFEDSAAPFHFAASVTTLRDFCGLVGMRPALKLKRGTAKEHPFTRRRNFTSFAPSGSLTFSSANFSVSMSHLPQASLDVFVDVFEKIDTVTVSGSLQELKITGRKKGRKQ